MPLTLDDTLPNVEFTDSSGSITNLYAYTGNKWLMIFTHKKFLHPSFATVGFLFLRSRERSESFKNESNNNAGNIRTLENVQGF